MHRTTRKMVSWAILGAVPLGLLAMGEWRWVVFSAFSAIYLIPAMLAEYRHHRQRIAIAILNILLGWTFIGWVAALVWACTSDGSDVFISEDQR